MLAHAREFYKGEPYEGGDGRLHYEFLRRGGDTDSVCLSSWREMRDHSATLGIPREAWPHYEQSIDMDVEDFERRNLILRDHLRRLTPSDIGTNELLTKIWRWVQNGDKLYFAEL